MLSKILLQLLKRLWYLLWRWASLSVNYSIYYFRRIVLFKNDQQARGLSDADYKLFLERKEKQIVQVKEATVSYEVDKTVFADGELLSDNKHVNALWIGSRLSKIEMLTLQSFVDNGHVFHLWTYGPIENELPEGVIMEDANEILPSDKIFRYKHVNKYGHGKGSVSGFSDIFRYKLLYEKGGWWIDMDVTCLKPLNVTTPYFFRQHHDLDLVGNVMKCPPQSQLMLSCFTEASSEVDENNTDWHKPIEILNKHVFANGLQKYIYGHVSNVDMWHEIAVFVVGNQPVPANYYFIHWMNEEWRSRDIDKNEFRYRSVLGEMMINAGLLQRPVSKMAFAMNDFWHKVFLRIYYQS
ncbi:MAG TPA: glycosyltransferase [Chitinophagales bacterium]|nr:glycosyltransferase [Chitinophagales bacterium]